MRIGRGEPSVGDSGLETDVEALELPPAMGPNYKVDGVTQGVVVDTTGGAGEYLVAAETASGLSPGPNGFSRVYPDGAQNVTHNELVMSQSVLGSVELHVNGDSGLMPVSGDTEREAQPDSLPTPGWEAGKEMRDDTPAVDPKDRVTFQVKPCVIEHPESEAPGVKRQPDGSEVRIDDDMTLRLRGEQDQIRQEILVEGESPCEMVAWSLTGHDGTQGRMGVTPPEGQHRKMSMAEELVYQSNPAIRAMGIDSVPSDVGNSRAVEWSLEVARRPVNPGVKPVKRHANELKLFDGKIPWRRWFSRFAADMRYNGWTGDECLASLSWCLRDGPGDAALTNFELDGDGTYEGLVECVARGLGSDSGIDQEAELEVRVQRKGEGHRQFGMALRVLAAEAFESFSPSDPWLVRKLSRLYIDGLEDNVLRAEVASQWKTNMSLSDIFDLTEDCLMKRKLLRTVTVTLGGTDSASALREGQLTSTESQQVAAHTPHSNPDVEGYNPLVHGSLRSPSMGEDLLPDRKMESVIKKVMKKVCKAEGGEMNTNPKKAKPIKDPVCHRCGKRGHFAKQCGTEGPKTEIVLREQKDVPASDSAPPPPEKLKRSVVDDKTTAPTCVVKGTSPCLVEEESLLLTLGKAASELGRQQDETGPQEPSVMGIGEVAPPGAACENELADMVHRACDMQLNPDDPVVGFLQDRGYNLGGNGDFQRFADIPSPLKGRRWYLPVKIHGRSAEFLIDTGASHSMIGRHFFRTLADLPDKPLRGDRVRSADGSHMQTYGKQVLSFVTNETSFVISPTVAELTDQGILGMDFCALYGVVLDSVTGELVIKFPAELRVQCVLRRISGVSSVAQTVRIPPRHVCNVVVYSRDVEFNRMGVVEPDNEQLRKLGLTSTNTLVQNSRRTVVPVSNMTFEEVYIEKGTTFGEVTYADVVGRADSPEVELAVQRAAELGALDSAARLAVLQGSLGAENESREGLPLHLLPLVTDSHLETDKEKDELAQLLCDNADIFSAPNEPLGRTDRVTHRIDTGSSPPLRLPYRRLPLSKKQALEDEVDKMLDEGIIRPSDSPWASPVVMVTKKDGTCRFCIDYRRLNGITRKNAYPLPRIDESLDSLGGNNWFCTLDLQSGYWQIGMHPDDREKTAFTTHRGLFEFNVMPFGLCNAPATFENMMETMLRGLLWKNCLVYLDDIIVFGNTREQCLSNLTQVMDRLRSYNLRLKPKKCKFFRRSVEYLGRIVSGSGISADPGKLEAVASWSTPRDAKEVRSFLGFCSYYRDFIPGFAEVSAPLQALVVGKRKGMSKPPPFVWTEAAGIAFLKLKELFTITPVLSYPTEDDPFILDTDASNDSIGAVLSQIQNGKEVPLAFASNSLSKTQRNYCTTKRELLAIVVYTKKFRHYLYGGNFTLRTDHSSLRWLLNFKEADGMMGRWISTLSELGIENTQIQHRSGVKHVNADCLSRKPIRRCARVDCDDCGIHNALVAPIMNFDPAWQDDTVFWSAESIQEAQSEDQGINFVRTLIMDRAPRPVRPALSLECVEVRNLVGQWSQLLVRDGLLCRWKTLDGRSRRRLQIVLPASLRWEVFEFFHGHQTSAHFGRKRTLDKLAMRYYWPGMSKDIIRWLAECPTCCLVKPGPGKGKSSLVQELFGVRFARIAIDIITGFQTTCNSNVCMMVVQDYYTKFVRVIPMRDHTAVTCAKALVKEWVLTFGAPLMLHSDQGREFESHLFQGMLDELAIVKTRTNPYRPQSDGMVERFNRTLIQGLTSLVNSKQDDWDTFSQYVAHAYNSTVHASTGCTPNSLVFGSEIIMPADLVFGSVLRRKDLPCRVAFTETLRRELRESYALVRGHLKKAAIHQKVGYDTGLRERKYVVGQKVVRLKPPVHGKISRGWDGPFEVTKVISDVTVLLKDVRGKIVAGHVDRLKPWLGRRPGDEDRPLVEMPLPKSRWVQKETEVAPKPAKATRKATPAKRGKGKKQKEKKKKLPVKEVVKKTTPGGDKDVPPVAVRRSARIAGRGAVT